MLNYCRLISTLSSLAQILKSWKWPKFIDFFSCTAIYWNKLQGEGHNTSCDHLKNVGWDTSGKYVENYNTVLQFSYLYWNGLKWHGMFVLETDFYWLFINKLINLTWFAEHFRTTEMKDIVKVDNQQLDPWPKLHHIIHKQEKNMNWTDLGQKLWHLNANDSILSHKARNSSWHLKNRQFLFDTKGSPFSASDHFNGNKRWQLWWCDRYLHMNYLKSLFHNISSLQNINTFSKALGINIW